MAKIKVHQSNGSTREYEAASYEVNGDWITLVDRAGRPTSSHRIGSADEIVCTYDSEPVTSPAPGLNPSRNW